MTPTPQQSQSRRHRDGPGRFLRGHAHLLVLLGLVSILLLLIALPIDEWLPPSGPSPVEDLPEWISPQTRTRIEQLRATIQRQGKAWRAGYTDISDLDPQQFQALLGARPPKEEILAETAFQSAPALAPSPEGETDLPACWDWRTLGAITPARAQGQCGSCWAFAAAAALEALAQIYAHRTLDVSEQHALDCNADNSGCAGGWMTAAYRLWRDQGALAEAQVPYTGEDDRPCQTEGATPIAAVIEWSSVSSALEDLKRMLLVGPLAVTMHVYPDFQHYREGVYEHEGDDPINHAVLLVGWDDALGAWIIKNSWGPGWGDAGFAHVRYGSCRLGAYAHRLAISADQPIEIRHQALADTLAGSPLAIEAMVTSAGSPLDSAAVRVWLDMGHGAEAVHPRWVGSNSHQITFSLPLPDLQAGIRVRYWIEAADTDGRLARFPQEGAAAIEFTIRRIFFSHDLETEPAWKTGLPGDAASAGWWQWGVPEASLDIRMRTVQPGSDHTAQGQCCFATGLARGTDQGDNDVDGGCATLETLPLDLSGLADATLRFWLWFSNHTGERPHDDSFIVRASSDGGAHWSDLFLTREGAGYWRRIVLPLDEKLALTRDVRFRFIASDSLADAVVEALIDDIEILTGTRESTDVADDHGVPGGTATPARLRLAPNPTRDRVTLRLDLGAAQRIEAVIFDAGGRLLRRLWSGTLPAGRSELVWDARDGADRPVAAGVYWLEVAFERGRERERRRIVVIR